IGGVALLVRCSAGLRRVEVRSAVVGTAVLAAVASVAAVLAQGPYDAGRPLGDAFRSQVLSPVLHSNFGLGAAARIGGSLLLLAGLLWGTTVERRVGHDATGRRVRQREGGRRARSVLPAWLLLALAGCAGLVVPLSL